MKTKLVGLFLFLVWWGGLAAAQDAAGLVTMQSVNDVDTTQAKLEAAIEATGSLKVMTIIDHAANAAGAGLELPLTRVVLFGNPNAGTPLMQAAPTVAIDLPQKMLIWQDASGQVWVAYNNPYYLKARHDIAKQDERIGLISRALHNLAMAATQ